MSSAQNRTWTLGIEHVRRLIGSSKPRLDCCGGETDGQDADGEESHGKYMDSEDSGGDDANGVSVVGNRRRNCLVQQRDIKPERGTCKFVNLYVLVPIFFNIC